MQDTPVDEIKASYQPNSFKNAIKKIDQRFQTNISVRSPLEDKWIDYIKMAIDGENGNRVNTLAQQYVNLANPLYSTALRQASAQRLSWLDDDWLDLAPDGSGVVDTSLANAVKTFQMKQLRNPYSNFYNSIKLTDLQCDLLNVSGLGYSYIVRTETTRKRTLEIENGKIRIAKSESEPKLAYQGAQAHFINMFNCYPDLLSPQFDDLCEVDLYLKEPARIRSLLEDERFNPASQYAYEDFVIYRDNSGLSKVLDNEYQDSDKERDIKQAVGQDVQDSDKKKGWIELRTAYVKEFCIEVGGNKEIHENVKVVYARCQSSDDLIPLLIEYNYRDFREKPILLYQQYQNPWAGYGKSQKGLSYNQACWYNFLRASQAYTVGKSTFRTRFIDSDLMESSTDLGVSQDTFNEAIRGAAFDIPYSGSTYNKGAAGIWSPEDNYQLRDVQLFAQEEAKAAAAIQEINTDLQNTQVADSTATGVDFVQARQTALFKDYLKNLSQNVLKPFVKMFLEDMMVYLYDAIVDVDLTEEELRKMHPDLEVLVEEFRQSGQEAVQEKMVSMGVDGIPVVMGTKINPVLKKEYVTLTKELLQNFKASIEIKIDGNDFDKRQAIADTLEVMNMIQTMGEGTDKNRFIALAIEEYLTLKGNKNKSKYMEAFQTDDQQQQLDQMQQMQQMELAQQQAQEQSMLAEAEMQEKQAGSMEKQAKAQNLMADANEEQSRADAQNLENEMAAELAMG